MRAPVLWAEESEDPRRTRETRQKLVGRQTRAGTRVRQSGAQAAKLKDVVFLGHAWNLGLAHSRPPWWPRKNTRGLG